jgi:Holliday junction resolvasome RuvABC endonuclease subunit
MVPDSILTLDIATTTGWANYRVSSRELLSGTFRLPKTAEDIGRFASEYWDRLAVLCGQTEPDIVIFEAPVLPPRTQITTLRKLYGLAAVTEMYCHRDKIQCREAHNGTVRKHFIGKSTRAGRDQLKAMVMVACKARGWSPADDNEADALAILDWWCDRMGVRTPWHRPIFYPQQGGPNGNAKTTPRRTAQERGKRQGDTPAI